VDERTSPWWYRRRGTLLGVIYGAGFFFGNLSFGGPGAGGAARRTRRLARPEGAAACNVKKASFDIWR
jgi:hypothetical protein